MITKQNHVFLDVDYTLVDFEAGHQAALVFLAKKYGKPFASRIEGIFRIILEGLRAQGDDWNAVPGGKQAFDFLRSRFLKLIPDILKVWSRELYAVAASEDTGMLLHPQDCMHVADDYWDAVGINAGLYPDARIFLQSLHDAHVPFHFFSSSDSRLVYRHDAWEYDPGYSAEKKYTRMKANFQSFGVRPVSIITGDPYDKPQDEFYAKMLKDASSAFGSDIHADNSIVIGDSFEGDVRAPVEKNGFMYGYWLCRGENRGIDHEKISVVSTLSEIKIMNP